MVSIISQTQTEYKKTNTARVLGGTSLGYLALNGVSLLGQSVGGMALLKTLKISSSLNCDEVN